MSDPASDPNCRHRTPGRRESPQELDALKNLAERGISGAGARLRAEINPTLAARRALQRAQALPGEKPEFRIFHPQTALAEAAVQPQPSRASATFMVQPTHLRARNPHHPAPGRFTTGVR